MSVVTWTYSIVYSPSLGDDGVDKGIYETFVGNIPGSGQDHNLAIDLRKLFSRALKLLLVDICDRNTLAAAIHESSRDRCSYAYKSRYVSIRGCTARLQKCLTASSRTRHKCHTWELVARAEVD